MTDSKPSKSALKRQQRALQALGEQLIDLGDELLDGLLLPDRLRDAIDDARRMKSREALRRQKQFIGRLMRDVDPQPIEALFDRMRADDRREKRVFTNAERWRDRIVRDGRAGLDAFEADSGGRHPDIGELIDALDRAPTERIERGIRKQLFRKIHAVLVTGSPDG